MTVVYATLHLAVEVDLPEPAAPEQSGIAAVIHADCLVRAAVRAWLRDHDMDDVDMEWKTEDQVLETSAAAARAAIVKQLNDRRVLSATRAKRDEEGGAR